MSDKPRTDWVSFSLGGLWAMEKDGGLLVPKCHPLSSSERAERLISYAAQGLGVPGFCIEMHPSGVWEVFVGNGTLRLLFDHSEKMRSDERWTVKECIAFRRSRIFICLFNPPAAELYRKAFWGTSDGER
ncbi:MAG: hypothetical protein JKP98_12630 [Rhodobacteraceae bacterium]|jgi:hypothetical protein|nr:hypothetical protein [Alphaproteobacteria bacterium]MBL4557627.1 hypothetical protein [Paracoccaceae bacterium]